MKKWFSWYEELWRYKLGKWWRQRQGWLVGLEQEGHVIIEKVPLLVTLNVRVGVAEQGVVAVAAMEVVIVLVAVVVDGKMIVVLKVGREQGVLDEVSLDWLSVTTTPSPHHHCALKTNPPKLFFLFVLRRSFNLWFALFFVLFVSLFVSLFVVLFVSLFVSLFVVLFYSLFVSLFVVLFYSLLVVVFVVFFVVRWNVQVFDQLGDVFNGPLRCTLLSVLFFVLFLVPFISLFLVPFISLFLVPFISLFSELFYNIFISLFIAFFFVLVIVLFFVLFVV